MERAIGSQSGAWHDRRRTTQPHGYVQRRTLASRFWGCSRPASYLAPTYLIRDEACSCGSGGHLLQVERWPFQLSNKEAPQWSVQSRLHWSGGCTEEIDLLQTLSSPSPPQQSSEQGMKLQFACKFCGIRRPGARSRYHMPRSSLDPASRPKASTAVHSGKAHGYRKTFC